MLGRLIGRLFGTLFALGLAWIFFSVGFAALNSTPFFGYVFIIAGLGSLLFAIDALFSKGQQEKERSTQEQPESKSDFKGTRDITISQNPVVYNKSHNRSAAENAERNRVGGFITHERTMARARGEMPKR
jgi:hypothetical protein